MTVRKSYRVFSMREMAESSTGRTHEVLLEMIEAGWFREASVEVVSGTSSFGKVLVEHGANVGEKVVIEE